MRELYDAAAKQRVTEGAKKGGVEKSKKTKVDSCPVAKVPQGTIELQDANPDPVPKKTSIKTRDQVGKLVGVSGRYIDETAKQKQGSTRYPGNCRDTSNHRWFFTRST